MVLWEFTYSSYTWIFELHCSWSFLWSHHDELYKLILVLWESTGFLIQVDLVWGTLKRGSVCGVRPYAFGLENLLFSVKNINSWRGTCCVMIFTTWPIFYYFLVNNAPDKIKNVYKKNLVPKMFAVKNLKLWFYGSILTLIRAAGGVYDFRNFEQV